MKPLVLVHGFMGGSEQWAAQAPLEEDRRVIAVDLPGFGRNAHLPALNRISDFADWVLDELTAQGVTQFDLMGHSMGGMIVQEMVHRAPALVDRLVLYGTGPVGELPGRFEPITTSMERAETDGPVATARRISATWFLEREAAEGYPACAAIAEKSADMAIQGGLQAMQGWSGQGYLAEISCKTLIVWGDHDRTYPWSQVELLWDGIPDAALAVVPQCAHAVHSEAPEVFNAIVRRFLE